MSLKAYQKAQVAVENPRSIEYRLFGQITGALMDAKSAGAKGMPLVVEISIAFSVLVAFIVIGVFLFRIRERFDSVDVQVLDEFRGERR